MSKIVLNVINGSKFIRQFTKSKLFNSISKIASIGEYLIMFYCWHNADVNIKRVYVSNLIC